MVDGDAEGLEVVDLLRALSSGTVDDAMLGVHLPASGLCSRERPSLSTC